MRKRLLRLRRSVRKLLSKPGMFTPRVLAKKEKRNI